MIKSATRIAAALAAFCLVGAPAQAGVNRAWVSGHGTDAAGCGAPTSPCRSLQYVVSNIINPGGEIDILDPAGYGAVTIPFSLSIVNGGVGVAGVQAGAGQNAITFNGSATDTLVLIGLNIEGLGGGANGIQFNSGLSVALADSRVVDFTGSGVNFVPNNGNNVFSVLQITNSALGGNNAGAIHMRPAGGTLGQLAINGSNLTGSPATTPLISIDASAESGGYLQATISNSFLHNTPGATLVVNAPSSGDAVYATINNSTITQVGNGFEADGSNGTIVLNASTITDTNTVSTITSGGKIVSFGNNGMYFYTALGPISPAGLQ